MKGLCHEELWTWGEAALINTMRSFTGSQCISWRRALLSQSFFFCTCYLADGAVLNMLESGESRTWKTVKRTVICIQQRGNKSVHKTFGCLSVNISRYLTNFVDGKASRAADVVVTSCCNNMSRKSHVFVHNDPKIPCLINNINMYLTDCYWQDRRTFYLKTWWHVHILGFASLNKRRFLTILVLTSKMHFPILWIFLDLSCLSSKSKIMYNWVSSP